MLRDSLKTFLNSLTEREFDAPLLAILAAQGFKKVHFIHGQFEFGKDFVAQRIDPVSGTLKQYAIQLKAGDMGLPQWREVRPQLEEAAYNTLGHPDFDASIPRVAVLATTGRLKGAAPVEAQQFKASLEARQAQVEFEVWDEQILLDWLEQDPALGLVGTAGQDFDAVLAKVKEADFSEPNLESFSRSWGNTKAGLVAVEGAVLGNAFRKADRLDMAALAALHMYRASQGSEAAEQSRVQLSSAALRLFAEYVGLMLDRIEPHLGDPRALAWGSVDVVGIVTYPAVICRLTELLALAALADEASLNHPGLTQRATSATLALIKSHPGAARPISDLYAVSVLAPATVALREEPLAAFGYLRALAAWLIDRYDVRRGGLGLASIDESDEVAVERLLGGSLESTTIGPRASSYLATVLLDLLLVAGFEQIYSVLRRNLAALRVVPGTFAADESNAKWRRGGGPIQPIVRIDYPESPTASPPTLSYIKQDVGGVRALFLASVCRSRHDVAVIIELVKVTPK